MDTHKKDPAATDLGAVVAFLPESSQSFATSLLNQSEYRVLSDKQMYWVTKLTAQGLAAKNGQAPAADAGTTILGFSAITDMLAKAAHALKYPKIVVDLDGAPLKMYVAGPRSSHAGDVQVVLGKNNWVGRVHDGVFIPRYSLDPFVFKAVIRSLCITAEDPAKAAKLYGQKYSHCCFCARELTDTPSLDAGYGPVCADHYGLPWGGK